MDVWDPASTVEISRQRVVEFRMEDFDNMSKNLGVFYKSVHLPARKSSSVSSAS